MYYVRNYSSIILKLASFFPVITLCGARQTGKTTLIKETFPDYGYVSLDLPSTAAMAENNPEEFFTKHPAPLIIDEIQYAPGLFRHLKTVVDNDRHNMGRYILTGSQKFNLMKEVSDSLAGRSVIIDLENLSRQEIFAVSKSPLNQAALTTLLTRGQFPELWRVPELPSSAFYSSYLATYLERDVRQILNVVSLRDFERFIRALAPRSGQLLNKTELARDVGVSTKAVNDWLSVLEASNQIVLLEPWYKNFTKRMIKSPKVYLCDSGLLCFLLGVDANNLGSSPFVGQIWETLVFAELRKLNRLQETPSAFWFYRDQSAREIDFILEKGGNLSCIEVKWTENPDAKDFKQITALQADIKKDSTYEEGNHYVICRSKNRYSLNSRIDAAGLDDIADIL